MALLVHSSEPKSACLCSRKLAWCSSTSSTAHLNRLAVRPDIYKVRYEQQEGSRSCSIARALKAGGQVLVQLQAEREAAGLQCMPT